MHKFSFIFVLILLLAVSSVSAELTLDAEEYGSVQEALNAVPEQAGTVTLKISKDNIKENDTKLDIPSDRGITELILLSSDSQEKTSLPEIERICANGVPLTVGAGLNLENASIYGGRCVSGEEAVIETSEIIVKGSVGFVFGGGFAENGGSSAVTETSVTLTKSGLVYFEIFGGGHAYGEDSIVKTNSTTLKISGNADYVLGGGFAEDGGTSECGRTDIQTTDGSSIPVALFSGGSASGNGSLSVVEDAKAVVAGEANWAFSGDFAFGGGQTRLNSASRLEILESGSTEIAYMGSFSSDEGSDAFINTAELMVCGTAGQIVQDSQSTDHGEAQTLVKALFPCR